MYVTMYKPIVKFSGAPRKCSLFAIFSKYCWFQTKFFTSLLEFMKLYEQNPLEIVFLFSLFTKTIRWL